MQPQKVLLDALKDKYHLSVNDNMTRLFLSKVEKDKTYIYHGFICDIEYELSDKELEKNRSF